MAGFECLGKIADAFLRYISRSMAKPPVRATLVWQGDLRLAAEIGSQRLVLDSDGTAGPSPVQALALALASCMSIDVVDILRKGRHPLEGLETTLVGTRAETEPRRFTHIELAFAVRGDVAPAAVERAIGLSRDKYCSVWHSMRQDIELVTSYDVRG
jgi:putative redox protein